MPEGVPYTVPRLRPLYGPPPYAYRGCPQLLVTFRSSAPCLRELTPEPLEPNPDDLAFLMIGTMDTDEFGIYREAIVAVPARVGEVVGNHVVAHYVEGDAPMAAGRELAGWPKQSADIRWSEDEATGIVTATCARAGATLIEAEATLVGPAGPEDLSLSPVWLNLKVVPSVRDDAPPEVAQITSMECMDLRIAAPRRGSARLGFRSTATNPLERIEVDAVLGAVFCRLSFDLGGGEVVHDYLAGEGAGRARAVASAGAPS